MPRKTPRTVVSRSSSLYAYCQAFAVTMPGLLQTQAEHFTKTKYVMALCAEFLGSMLFSFTGSALLSVALADAAEPNVVMAALGNAAGITIAGISGLIWWETLYTRHF